MDKQISIPNHYYKYWTDLIKPRGFEVDETSLSDTYGKFYIRPLERSYGLTLGNSIRRVLLNSMMGSAVYAIKFEGVLHEFTTIEGVLEDVTDLILNLKSVRFRQDDAEDKIVRISKKGIGKVTAADLQLSTGIEVLNPEAHIATLRKEGELNAEILVCFARGYIEASRKSNDLPAGYIPIDSIHSPIRRVNYSVNNARVGQRTDYDSLILEVWTDGSLKPVEAVPLGYKILKEQLQVFMNFDENIEPKPEIKRTQSSLNENLFRPAEDLELSVRSANCLKNARIRYIGDLVTKTEQDMLKTKNFGRKSLNEIKEILKDMDLRLGMDIDGWPPADLHKREIASSEGRSSSHSFAETSDERSSSRSFAENSFDRNDSRDMPSRERRVDSMNTSETENRSRGFPERSDEDTDQVAGSEATAEAAAATAEAGSETAAAATAEAGSETVAVATENRDEENRNTEEPKQSSGDFTEEDSSNSTSSSSSDEKEDV